jgi:hypothetical protein
VVSCLAMVVLPVLGVPVMRMTRLLMFSIGVERIVIACACFWEGWKSKLVFFGDFLSFLGCGCWCALAALAFLV